MRPDEEMEKRINESERKSRKEQSQKLLRWMLERQWTKEECLAMLAKAWVDLDALERFSDVAANLLKRHNIIDQQITDMQQREPGRVGRLVELLELDIPSSQTKALSVAIKAGKREGPASGGDGTINQMKRRKAVAFQWLEANMRKKEGGGWAWSINRATGYLEAYMDRFSKEEGDKRFAVKADTCRKYVKEWMEKRV